LPTTKLFGYYSKKLAENSFPPMHDGIQHVLNLKNEDRIQETVDRGLMVVRK